MQYASVIKNQKCLILFVAKLCIGLDNILLYNWK